MATASTPITSPPKPADTASDERTHRVAFIIMAAVFIGAPLVGVYPVFMMKVMCFALFACAFNLLLGFGGLLSFVLAIFLGGFLIIYRIIHSPYGQVLKAIRENEPRTISLGYDADKFKHRAFVLSAALAGLAGATKAIVFQLASLTDVHWSMSGEVVLMTLVGGLGTIFGPVVGAAVIVTMQNYLAQLGAWVTVVQGVIFVLCVLLFRRGIVGEIGHLLKKSL